MSATQWFYVDRAGLQQGPVLPTFFQDALRRGDLQMETLIWREGLSKWVPLQQAAVELGFYGAPSHPAGPVPAGLTPQSQVSTYGQPATIATGERVNNIVVWFLAFAPLIGFFLECVVAGVVYGGDENAVTDAINANKFWFVTLALNIALSVFDATLLKKAGHNTDKFKGWVWLVPVYLYQRAKATKQNLACFIVWIVCFVLVLFG